MASLKGKVCMVTGASSGIGAATAIYFASLGAKLAITGRNTESLDDTKRKCIEEGLAENEVFISAGDLAVDADLERVFEECASYYNNTLDVLVNNAGIGVVASLLNTTMEMYDKQMNINTRSVFYLTRLAAPLLIKSKGTIVNVSSVNGLRSFPGLTAYCMSKSAIDQFTRCTALDLASTGVRCNAVNPGVIVTDIHKRGGMDEVAYAAFLERSKMTHALGRVGQADEVAKAISFFASDESSFITGATLPIDGGRHAMCPR
ncbi:PREDICTED: 3-oxoacyl-[acyl-carrier-protein] reductase FabG-like isoform X1 [Priapulus caudatus]|uniref:3-oxoacyl-[acyl-carrier-protein] reductase FabG-like isoform X1 n=1 Tax=Priapulus caudatus TaxID=37621 RepID=A0ABM1F1X7_PRICU|nr:PREDICTED: 3-oxoacyl-[acyl-carrier-protein] reductase FabG-like isoform X1 [Priapulus caudatus]